MNGRAAKMIRKTVYGDYSIRQERKYTIDRGDRKKGWGTIKATGLREQYQKAKKIYYKKKSGQV